MPEGVRLILASTSSARRAMLDASGLPFDVEASGVDEPEVRAAMMSNSDCVEAADIAMTLAQAKAVAVSRRRPGALVIGSDQVLSLGRRMFSKAETPAEARDALDILRGRTHELTSAVALARDGEIVWSFVDSAWLTMRRFSNAFLDRYIGDAGDRILQSVGCYEIEGPGVQLFERVEGDYFTILGMPLLPLLAALREHGAVET